MSDLFLGFIVIALSFGGLALGLILRNYFITGVVVLIPIGFTLYLSKFFIGLSSKIIPQNINPNNYLPYAIPGIEIFKI